MRIGWSAILAAAGLGAVGTAAQAQAVPEAKPLEVGAVAPEFELAGGTRFGTLKSPIKLSDYKGKTVVLAFFYKARTKG